MTTVTMQWFKSEFNIYLTLALKNQIKVKVKLKITDCHFQSVSQTDREKEIVFEHCV